ncbi:MAG: SAM-dependent methyltransferase [Acetobacteraceae bacterium]|nr:MAG: SAM-dependent methyltransferase [Acetobacteraceae bacterium]
MRHEVHGLRDFYATPAGLVAARLLRDHLRTIWPRLPGQAVLGLGYASPFLRLWRPDQPGGGARCISLVPPHMPHWRWPRSAASRTAVGEGESLPFPDLSFDRILLVHGLEHAENVRRMLREAWRVLKDDGRLLVVAPNRHGLWAHLERTPFGHGEPYSTGQLERLLRRQMFAVTRRQPALFVPPFQARMLLRGAMVWERLGNRLLPGFAGVTLMEATKDFSELIPAGAVPATIRRRRVVVAETA